MYEISLTNEAYITKRAAPKYNDLGVFCTGYSGNRVRCTLNPEGSSLNPTHFPFSLSPLCTGFSVFVVKRHASFEVAVQMRYSSLFVSYVVSLSPSRGTDERDSSSGSLGSLSPLMFLLSSLIYPFFPGKLFLLFI